MLLSEFPRLSPWIEFGRIGKVRSLCVDTSGVAISLAWYFRQYAVRTRALVNDKEDYNMYFTKRLTWKVGALRFRNTGIFFEYICTNFCYSNIHDGSNDYVIFPSNKKQNWRDITENTHGDYYISLAPNTPREISIDDHSTPRYNLKIFYRIYRIIIIREGNVNLENETRCAITHDRTSSTRLRLTLDAKYRSISIIFQCRAAVRDLETLGLKVQDGAVTETEGRKEVSHATDPSLGITLSSSRLEKQTEKKRRRNGRKERRNWRREEPGKGGQLEPSHYNDWLSLQKQTPHLLRSLLPQLPAVITRLCVCEHALVRVNTRGHQHRLAIRARRGRRTF